MTVRRLSSKAENIPKTKPIFSFLHEYESRYGDLVQVINLESRMRELFPEDPTLTQFAHRHAAPNFDPMSAPVIISASQTRPPDMASVEQQHASMRDTPSRYLEVPSTDSPKRTYPTDDYDDDGSRPRKFLRAESPLKSGGVPSSRRPDQLKRPGAQSNGSPLISGGQYRPQPSAAPLPRDVVQLLSIIPPASAYNAGRFSAEKLVDLLRRMDIPTSVSQLRPPPQAMPYGGKFLSFLAPARPFKPNANNLLLQVAIIDCFFVRGLQHLYIILIIISLLVHRLGRWVCIKYMLYVTRQMHGQL